MYISLSRLPFLLILIFSLPPSLRAPLPFQLSRCFPFSLFFHANRDTSSVDDTNGLITYCSTTSTFNGDVSTWDVSSVTDMNSMFQYAKAFNQPLAAWDVSSVTDME